MNVGQNTFWKCFVSWVITGWLTLFSHFGTYDSIKHCEKNKSYKYEFLEHLMFLWFMYERLYSLKMHTLSMRPSHKGKAFLMIVLHFCYKSESPKNINHLQCVRL